MTKPQVSRRIPVLKLPAKKTCASEDVSVSHVSEIETGMSSRSVDIRSDHEGVVKKPKLQKQTKDSLLACPIEAGHLQNIAMLGAECLGSKTAKVTYVGSGLMSLPSPALSGVCGTPTLSYGLYTPFIDSAQPQTGSDVSSQQHTNSKLLTAGFSLVQAPPAVDMCSVDESRSWLTSMSSRQHTSSTLPTAGSSLRQTSTVVNVCSVDESKSWLTSMSSQQHKASQLPTAGSSLQQTSTVVNVCSVDESKSWLTSMSSQQHTASQLPTAGSSLRQTSTPVHMYSVDSSVNNTEVIKTVAGPSSLSDAYRHHSVSLQNQQQRINPGR